MASISEHVCAKQVENSNMGGVECYNENGWMFYLDRNGWVSVGDTVKLHSDDQHNYREVYVNGVLKTKDNFGDLYPSDYKRGVLRPKNAE